MKRTTIFLDEAMERDLQAIARQQKRAVASVVREAIAAYVTSREGRAAPPLSFIGAGASGRTDIAERHEELLWPADPSASKARTRVARPSRRRR